MRYVSFAGPQLCYQRVFDTSDAPPATMHVYLNSWLETSAVLKGKVSYSQGAFRIELFTF